MNIEELQNLPDAEKAKIFAARYAVEGVQALGGIKDDMKIGIGTGSTAAWFVRLLAGSQERGLKFRACATSTATTELAQSLGIKIEPLDAFVPSGKPCSLDLAIDGADEFDPDHNLIKGGGGALLQEKMVEQMAERFIVITDASKAVEKLGKFPLPVEVVRFGWQTTQERIIQVLSTSVLGRNTGLFNVAQRMVGDEPFITDEGHYILDLHVQFINKLKDLEIALKAISGVVETGLFIGMANEVVMADGEGLVKSRETGKEWIETSYDWNETFAMLQ